jgi:hypothetical protein
MIRKNLLVLNYQTEKLHNQEKHKKTRTPWPHAWVLIENN